MTTSGKKIILTGASGFLGKITLANLLGEFDVTTIKHQDLQNTQQVYDLLENSDAVIHLAALIKGTEDELHQANWGTTKIIVDTLSKINTRTPLIFASSFAVYSQHEDMLIESADTTPSSPYGKSKYASEMYIKESGIRSFILRFSNLYGPTMPPFSHSVVSTFAKLIKLDKKPSVNGDGNQARDFIHVSDAARAIEKALSMSMTDVSKSEVVNICSARSTSMNELIKILNSIANKDIKAVYNLDVMEKGYWIGSNQKAQELLSWQPVVNLEAGLKEVYEKI